MTLWELAQRWTHAGGYKCPDYCHRCQLEQWAREKAEEMKKSELMERVFGEDGMVPLEEVLKILGVPSEVQYG